MGISTNMIDIIVEPTELEINSDSDIVLISGDIPSDLLPPNIKGIKIMDLSEYENIRHEDNILYFIKG